MFKIIIFSFVAGVLGTLFGGIVSCVCRARREMNIQATLAIASGFMLAITCFELIPSAVALSGIVTLFVGIIIGVLVIALVDIMSRKFAAKSNVDKYGQLGIVVLFAIGIHNFPEGMAIGSSEAYGSALAMTILMFLHNIPEGMAIATPLLRSGAKRGKVFGSLILSGVPTVLGAILGASVGGASSLSSALCLSLSAGAMLYVVVCELYKECYKDEGKQNTVASCNLLGILFGLALILVV